ncbi:MAG: hypothetical protein M3Z14_06265 [Candidatus Eremiobacteraeota bacterium]|nr:hypothetical protein [Candidatus Eremiobacteraeota bacterium]
MRFTHRRNASALASTDIGDGFTDERRDVIGLPGGIARRADWNVSRDDSPDKRTYAAVGCRRDSHARGADINA